MVSTTSTKVRNTMSKETASNKSSSSRRRPPDSAYRSHQLPLELSIKKFLENRITGDRIGNFSDGGNRPHLHRLQFRKRGERSTGHYTRINLMFGYVSRATRQSSVETQRYDPSSKFRGLARTWQAYLPEFSYSAGPPMQRDFGEAKRIYQFSDELLPVLLRHGCPRNLPFAWSCGCTRIFDRNPST